MTATMKQGQPIAIAMKHVRDGSQQNGTGDTRALSPRRAKVRTRPSDPAPARSSSTMSGPVAVGPHVKSARPGVLMLTRRSPTATRPARGPDARTSVTLPQRAKKTPSEPAGARTTTVSEAVAGRVLATASRSWALEWSRRVMSNVLCAPRPSQAGLFCLLSYRGLAVLSSRRSFGRGGGVGLSGDNPFGCWRAAAARRLDFAT